MISQWKNVIDSLNRTSVKRPLTYVRQNAYQQITAEETVVAAAPVYRWLTRQTPGVLRQLEREFVTDDHRLWPKDAPDPAPADAHARCPRKRGRRSGSGCRQSWTCGIRKPGTVPMP